jgi:hypothetical protein
MKKYLHSLPIFICSLILAGCNLPAELTQFSPGQIINRTANNTVLSESPKPSVVNSGNCTETSCSITESQEKPIDVAYLKSNGEETVRQFLTNLDEDRFEQAVEMLSSLAAADETTKKTWLENFKSIQSLKISAIEPYNKPAWTNQREQYLVVVDIQTTTGDFAFGWDNGENTRWIEVVQNPQTNIWEINSISTGP